MLKERAGAVSAGLRALDLALVAAAFGLALALRAAVDVAAVPPLLPPGRHLAWLAVALALWPAAAGAAGVYGQYRTRSRREEILRLARAVGLLALGVAAASFLGRDRDLSRLLLLGWLGIALALLAGSRVAVRTLAHEARRRGHNTRAFAVVGGGPLARAMRQRLLARPEWGFTFAGFVLEQGVARRGLPGPVLGRLDELAAVLERHVVDLVVFAVPRDRLPEMEAAVAACQEQGVVAKIGLEPFPARHGRLTVEDLDGIPVLSYASAPQDALPLLAKRAFDVLASALALIVLSPVLAAAALAVRLGSPGPVLFRQRRVGLSGRTFTLYKFRSMRTGAEAEQARLADRNEMDGPVFKLRDDPRVTRVGKVLRRTSLDELPQLWNVLRGEMSLVGPRPPLPEEVRRYERWQRRRLSVKPGLTCTWQVSGRSEVGFGRWMQLDLDYIDRWSLWQDMRIVLRTIPAVLLGRGAR
ncbi:exopolysaccharide biosynthesis polyprenyl glycosylphosphotransferase [Anaeromyxobacter sp. K]|uniref:sugar transferase n=1 Tax=Anaeromyxobacter sp. (strain K) TaxID=447217 RepID=UPI00017BE248|nr:sugar transferase [Anaeromyxobacter sp. K]ACG72635.1 exopolysaccharide biosynthesis polyprenyl glycosylphosphotransferase [Anaeromyxobacter sp. K]